LERLRGRFTWPTCLIRQFFPKGNRFEEIAVRSVKRGKGLLNRRPRKPLGFAIPTEVLFGKSFGEDFAYSRLNGKE